MVDSLSALGLVGYHPITCREFNKPNGLDPTIPWMTLVRLSLFHPAPTQLQPNSVLRFMYCAQASHTARGLKFAFVVMYKSRRQLVRFCWGVLLERICCRRHSSSH